MGEGSQVAPPCTVPTPESGQLNKGKHQDKTSRAGVPEDLSQILKPERLPKNRRPLEPQLESSGLNNGGLFQEATAPSIEMVCFY